MTAERFDVVVVDDADDVRAVVANQLRLSGRFAVVAEGRTGADAVSLAGRHQPAVVLLDVSMPDVDGLEAIAAVRAAAPRAQVVVLSGFEAASLERTARTLGAADYVEKSAPIRDLPARLLTVLGAAGHAEQTPTGGQAGGPGGAEAVGLAAVAPDAAQVLAEHVERFRTVFDKAAIGMATLTLAGRIVRANEALARTLGTAQPDLVGLCYADLAGPEASDQVAALIAQAGQGDRDVVEVEHPLAQPQGRWVHATLAAVRDPGEPPLYLLAQIEDVTGRRDMVADLRASEERFRLLVEGVRDYAIFMLDPEGRISTWNLGAERLKGYGAEEIIGQHFRIFYPAEARAVHHPEAELEIAARDGRYEEEGWRIRKDGSRFWANVVITALFDPAGNLAGFAKVTRDVSERREAAQAQARVAAELAEANARLRAGADRLAEFVAITAHELQSPIAAMAGAADILSEHWDRLDEAGRRDSLESITRGATRLRRLLADLLTTSRLEAGAFPLTVEDVEIRAAAAEAVRELRLPAQTVEIQGPPVTARADRSRVVQIVTNLVSNANRYGRPPITVVTGPADGAAEIRVHDAGQGIPEELVPRLFGKFSRGRRPGRPGTGLGLFIVRELARAQQGDAWYERGEDGRPAFVVRLPAAEPAPSRPV